MEFIETRNFAKAILELLTEDEYLDLQIYLIEFPDSGDLIKGGGGLRKLRFAIHNRGKSGGVRVIYYWRSRKGKMYLMEVYPKSVKTDLRDSELAALAKMIKELDHE
jgi:hypothetical protein